MFDAGFSIAGVLILPEFSQLSVIRASSLSENLILRG